MTITNNMLSTDCLWLTIIPTPNEHQKLTLRRRARYRTFYLKDFEINALKAMGETIMPIKINQPTIIEAAGNKPKRIEEYIGHVNSQTSKLSVARMVSPAGWVEPGQTPEFDEYTVVLKGMLRVKTKTETWDIHAGEAIIIEAHEWVQYSSPNEEGAEYIAVCSPAFSPDTVHRDDE